ncbi:MAG TPA: hypothetical protein VFW38_05360 [Solirubrobacteraceae bacterium]|nr:hypothetical protein [Solirubrobacteraceae bacterium]
MSTTAVIQTRPTSGAKTRTADAIGAISVEDKSAIASEREQLTDRLRSLRRVLPALAQEMAAARRQAAHLRIDNRRLSEQVRELRAQLEARESRTSR